MNEWSENAIIDEFHESKQKTLDTYEEDARFFYIQQKGNEQEMNKFVLNVIQNLSITIERVYLRIEDPYPFALGVLLPKVIVRTCDSSYSEKPGSEPSIAFKVVRIEDLSIFMERDPEEVAIDRIIRVEEINDIETREARIYEHIRNIFAGIGKGEDIEEESKEEEAVPGQPLEIDDQDYLLK